MKSKVYIVMLVLLLSISLSTVGLANPQTYSFNFINEDVCVVLRTVAKIAHTDIVIDDSIKGNITMRLNNVSLTTALDMITEGKGLAYRKVDNYYIIEPADMGKTEVTKLRFVRAIDLKKTIEPIASNLKVKIEVDDVSNSIVATGSPAGCARVKNLLATLDVAQQQIVIESKVVSINKTDAKQLGVDWSWDTLPQYPKYETTDAEIDGTTGIITKYPKTTVTRNSNYKGMIQFGRTPEGHPFEFNYSAKLSALISKGNAKVMASPKVSAINGKEARVFIGDSIPVLTDTSSGGTTSTTVKYVDAGIKMLYTPTITADGTITVKIFTQVATPTLVAEIKNYRITTREAETTVCMKDGETIVIAGLIANEEVKNDNKVPFLGDLPLIGGLFKSNSTSKNETEVVIFLTAKIVK